MGANRQQIFATALNRYQAGEPMQADAACRTLLAHWPDDVDALNLRAVLACSAGRYADGIALTVQALAQYPDNVQALSTLGDALHMSADGPGAIAAFERAVKLAPRDAGLRSRLGTALLDTGYFIEAEAAYRQSIALADHVAQSHFNHAVALSRLVRTPEAIAAYRKAIALDPRHVAAHLNLGNVLLDQDQFSDAIDLYQTAIALDPEFAKAYSSLAEALREEGRLDEALGASRKAVALASCDDIQRLNHALALLMEGDHEAGWPAYEVRRKAGVVAPHERRFAVPEWRGETLRGRTLLLHAEQGLGDTLQFARFVERLIEPGVSIVIECQKPLTGLLRSLGPIRVVTQGEPLPPFDFHLPLMSLPNVLRTRLDTIPAAVPYLAADPTKIARWKARIGPTTDLAVGVVWSGNPGHKSDRRRSIAAAAVLPDLVMPGVRLFSLQKDPRDQDITTLEAMAADVTDLAPSLNDFSDTAAALEALDLVIAVDTSTAHLAGALGRPVWLMLPFALDWRWLRDREDSPWYPTMRLFRQSTPRVWTDVIGRIRTELSVFNAGSLRD
jgi:tetratricopeptide (TPR) repeat protein